jgi:hypothetical protein
MDVDKNVYDEIARAAYELYEKRGKDHGRNLNDWLEAERTVMKGCAPEIEAGAKVVKATKKTKTTEKTKSKKQ